MSKCREDQCALVYDFDLKAPACVLIQAARGCGASPPALRHFDSRYWLIAPTPGMLKIVGTDEEWNLAAEVTAAKWGDQRPKAEPGKVR